MHLRYNVPLSDLPSKCVFSEKYTIAMPCHAKREGSWCRDTTVFANYLPHLLIRFASMLKSNDYYSLSIMSDSTSEVQ